MLEHHAQGTSVNPFRWLWKACNSEGVQERQVLHTSERLRRIRCMCAQRIKMGTFDGRAVW
eukprot:1143680-Pelagomonas_calceolata.AAC.2